MRNVYLYLLDTMADWEAAHITAELNSARFFKKNAPQISFKTAGCSEKAIKTMGGLTVIPDCAVSDIAISESTVLLLPGAERWQQPEHAAVLKVAEKLLEANAVVAAACGATVALASHGILDSRPHTSNGVGFLDMFCPEYRGQSFYVDEPSVSDNGLITAGSTGSLQWARDIIKALGVFSPETLSSWYSFFSTGKAEHFFAIMGSLPASR